MMQNDVDQVKITAQSYSELLSDVVKAAGFFNNVIIKSSSF